MAGSGSRGYRERQLLRWISPRTDRRSRGDSTHPYVAAACELEILSTNARKTPRTNAQCFCHAILKTPKCLFYMCFSIVPCFPVPSVSNRRKNGGRNHLSTPPALTNTASSHGGGHGIDDSGPRCSPIMSLLVHEQARGHLPQTKIVNVRHEGRS